MTLATLLVALTRSRCWALLCIAVDIHCLSFVRALIVLLCQVHDHELAAVQAHFVQGSSVVLQPQKGLFTNPGVATFDSSVQAGDVTSVLER